MNYFRITNSKTSTLSFLASTRYRKILTWRTSNYYIEIILLHYLDTLIDI